jgi:hypothetical protein
MNTQAESTSDEIFLAVHSQYPLTLRQTTFSKNSGNTALRWQVEPEQFLRDFLLEREDYQPQVAVLGDVGSGKSHFIHWLKVRIPSSPKRLLITVPKTGTSLRNVVKQLIDVLPPEEALRYREQFTSSTQTPQTTEMRRARLISVV